MFNSATQHIYSASAPLVIHLSFTFSICFEWRVVGPNLGGWRNICSSFKYLASLSIFDAFVLLIPSINLICFKSNICYFSLWLSTCPSNSFLITLGGCLVSIGLQSLVIELLFDGKCKCVLDIDHHYFNLIVCSKNPHFFFFGIN